jgi:hypothetical protein
VYSAEPSPNRKPQLRQNRSSLGIGERQFPQVVTGSSVSGFINTPMNIHYRIHLRTFPKERIADVYTPNGAFRLHPSSASQSTFVNRAFRLDALPLDVPVAALCCEAVAWGVL